MSSLVREAVAADADAIGEIHSQGIEERVATFRTEPRGSDEVIDRLRDPRYLMLISESDGEVTGWASRSPYGDPAAYYAGVGEASVFVRRGRRGEGAGKALLQELASRAEALGNWKLIAKIFATNDASLRLFRVAGYEEVGVHRRHGSLEGQWRDVVVVEKLLGEAAD